MMEILFECYSITRVLPLVGPLLDNYTTIKNRYRPENNFSESHPVDFGMVVHLGYTHTTVIPIVNHQVMHKFARNISVGTKNIYENLCTHMYYKYDHLGSLLDHSTLSLVYERYLSAALDYDTQLQYFDKGVEAFKASGGVHPLVG